MKSNLFFPRGNGPLVSILIPSRGRPESLYKMIDKAYELAGDKSLVEFVLRIDLDDQETIECIDVFPPKWKIKVCVGERKEGYDSLHEYYQDCANMAIGDWLWIFNDDVEILSENWEQNLLRLCCMNGWVGVTDVCLLSVREREAAAWTHAFCLVRRKAWEIMGKFSRSPLIDEWLWSVFSTCCATLNLPVEISHKRPAGVGGAPRIEITSLGTDRWHTMTHVDQIEDRLNDCSKLVEHMDAISSGLVWKDKPGEDGWYWWRNKNGTPHSMAVSGGEAYGPKYCGYNEEYVNYKIETIGGEWADL